MKIIWISFVISLILSCSNSQYYRVTEYKCSYLFDHEILSKLERDTMPWRFQISASDFAMKSDYFNALGEWDKAIQPRIIEVDSEFRDSIARLYTPIPAKEYIIDQAANNTILILNEAHHNSSHRLFARSLLEGLYENGYRLLGVEGLGNGKFLDKSLNERKYPILETGYYTKDPQFGNFLRDALEMGFRVFAYEKTSEVKGAKYRESEQANHIAEVIKEHPEEKLFIYCGFDHGLEGKHPSWEMAMAERLKNITGVDPLTVNQVHYSEKSKHNYSPAIVQVINPSNPVVLLDDDDFALPFQKAQAYSDIAVVHPFGKEQSGRADWLFRQFNKMVNIPIPEIETNYPVMVLAYVEGEDIQTAIPYDIIELASESTQCTLALKPGNYNIVLSNDVSGAFQMPYTCK